MKNNRRNKELISMWLKKEEWEHMEDKLKNYPSGEIDLFILGLMLCNAYKSGDLERK
jgi:hypothetical protein